MKLRLHRQFLDKSFTVIAAISVILITITLVIVLGPMLYRGSKAVFFHGTVEFRKMQLNLFDRGDKEEIDKETTKAAEFREKIYSTIEQFKEGIDADTLSDKAKAIYKAYGNELRLNNITGEQFSSQRKLAREIRNKLQDTFKSNDRDLINSNIEFVLQYRHDERFANTSAAEFFTLAENFKKNISSIDLEKREKYSQLLKDTEEQIDKLLGPRPGQALPPLPMHQYGMTRLDMSKRVLNRVLWIDNWVQVDPGKPLVNQPISRASEFAGTEMEPLFDYIESNLDKIMRPKFTFYWQYFIDDSTHGHYFGGVGPEILGTLLLTILSMLIVFPLGIIAAAFLVECSTDNIIIRIIRMCINTLAGVPSIVFGLFGLAFFVLVFVPLLGGPSMGCILAASLTLAVLTLPVMIRASEEAIRSVPQTYKEASLGLGASRFTTFIKVTFPAALPGILTGVILSLSRVAGETAPILFTGAVALGPLPKSIYHPTRTLSYACYDIAVCDRLAMQVPHKQYGMVMTLVLLILVLNAVAIFLRSRAFKKLKGQ